MLANQDHRSHPIIRRQLKTFRSAGYELTVVDQGSSALPASPPDALHVVSVRPVSLGFAARLIWRVLRRIDERRLGELWWTVVYFAQVLLTDIRYFSAAVRKAPDYYHAHDLETLLPALIAGAIHRRPVVYDAHELTSEQGDPSSMRKRVERWLERRLVPRVDYLVAPNVPRAQVYAERCELRNPAVIVRNCPPTLDIARTDALRQHFGFSADMRIVVYHGTLMEGRALDNLIASAREFDDGIRLVVIGAQSEYFKTVLEPLANSLPDPSRVRFMPFIEPDRVLHYVASADLGVVIYKNINLNNYLCAPTKLYEYLMVGLPVVTSNFPEMTELLERFPVGQTFDPEQPSSIAAAINGFFRTRQRRAATIEGGLSEVRREFTWERESRKLLNVFGGVR